jgi:hypothetical protein
MIVCRILTCCCCIHTYTGYGYLRELVRTEKWFSLHVLFKRFGWMLFNAWQSNSETLFTYTRLLLKNRNITDLVANVCTYNTHVHAMESQEVYGKYVPSHCWLGVKTRQHGQSILSACVEKRVYNDIKFTLDAWCEVFKSEKTDLFDELQDSFHFHLVQEDLLLVAENYSPLFCDFLVNMSSKKSSDWMIGGRVRDKFRQREDNMKMKSFDLWYQMKYLHIKKKTAAIVKGDNRAINCDEGDEVDDDDEDGLAIDTNGGFWASEQTTNNNILFFDIVESDGLSMISMYEEMFDRDTEYRATSISAGHPATRVGWCSYLYTFRTGLLQSIRDNFGSIMDKRKARSQVLIEGRFMPLRNTLCGDLVFLRACLATQNIEIFDTEILSLTVDYAWRAYGR